MKDFLVRTQCGRFKAIFVVKAESTGNAAKVVTDFFQKLEWMAKAQIF